MHQTIRNGLEDYLAGTVSGDERNQIETHLTICQDCREQIETMRELSALFPALRSTEPPIPSPGFYARVSMRIERENPSSFWAAFLEPAFGKRIALASLLVLASLGTLLMSNETQYATAPTPEMILAAEQDAPSLDGRHFGGDQMLFTLVSHKQ